MKLCTLPHVLVMTAVCLPLGLKSLRIACRHIPVVCMHIHMYSISLSMCATCTQRCMSHAWHVHVGNEIAHVGHHHLFRIPLGRTCPPDALRAVSAAALLLTVLQLPVAPSLAYGGLCEFFGVTLLQRLVLLLMAPQTFASTLILHVSFCHLSNMKVAGSSLSMECWSRSRRS